MYRLLLLIALIAISLFNAACTPGTYYPFGGGPGQNQYYEPAKGYDRLYH